MYEGNFGSLPNNTYLRNLCESGNILQYIELILKYQAFSTVITNGTDKNGLK